MNTRIEATCLVASSLLAGLCVVSSAARAELVQFTLEEAQSALTISGTFAGFAIEPQATGSLMARYTGTIQADVAGSDIQFVGGSIIAAITNGNWEPAAGGASGAAPANYGGEVVNLLVDGQAALREVRFDLTSNLLPASSGTFNAQELLFNFLPAAGSVIDYNYTSLLGSGSGSQVLTGASTNATSTNGTLIAQGNESVLTIPVDISGSLTVNMNDVRYRFRGQLVARAAAAVPLQITSFQVTPGQLNFSLATTPGQAYTILGSTNLMDWPLVIDQFTATNNPAERTVSLPDSPPEQYFRVRRD